MTWTSLVLGGFSRITCHAYTAPLVQDAGLPLLMIVCAGEYTDRHSGCDEDNAAFLSAMAAAYIEISRCVGVIWDYRQLRYEWGDRMADVLLASQQSRHWSAIRLLGHITASPRLRASRMLPEMLPLRIVTSGLCDAGFRSLLSVEQFGNPQDILFQTPDDAVASIREEITDAGGGDLPES